ncbi:hypothetical protein N0V90_013343 [Kalmusia sp. IMI 367209]|nr:hypothetical protein N0V90_013343 [Kalmusia sp. IMI 367209]
MLGYISSTRKKSCRQCVKAKRRCDLGYPCCKRCFSKALDCAYPNASVREAEVVIRQRTPDLAPLPGDVDIVWAPAEPSNFDPALLQTSESSSSPESLPEQSQNRVYWKRSAEPQVSRHLLPKIWAPSWLNDEQVLFMVSRMRSFVPTLAFTGCNTFVHAKLYEKHQPAAFQDSCSLSALYLAKTKQNTHIIHRSIEDKINGLIASSHGWSLPEHLAAVQALIIYQIIRLFDGDTNIPFRSAAARQNHLLEVWTAHLWKRSFSEPISFKKPWDAWVFYESLRRTVMISVFLRGGWTALTQDGLCDQVPVLARLPLSKGDGFWDIDEAEFERRVEGEEGKDQLIAYGDFSLTWQPGDDLEKLTEFQRLLLAPCRGAVDPRLYLAE